MSDSFEEKVKAALNDPQNVGEMQGADAVGTAGSADCGDMLRMWIKFRDEDGHKVIDRASFQTFGCQTALAVASVATRLIQGKTIEEAAHMGSEDLSAPLGALPPMRIHCAQLVESALKDALGAAKSETKPSTDQQSPGLAQSLTPSSPTKIVFKQHP